MSQFEFGDFAAVANHNQTIKARAEAAADHRAQLKELEKQTRELQSKNRIEADRAMLERQRLEIEKKRLQAEEAERELQRIQADKIKHLRMLLADTITAFDKLKKTHPVS